MWIKLTRHIWKGYIIFRLEEGQEGRSCISANLVHICEGAALWQSSFLVRFLESKEQAGQTSLTYQLLWTLTSTWGMKILTYTFVPHSFSFKVLITLHLWPYSTAGMGKYSIVYLYHYILSAIFQENALIEVFFFSSIIFLPKTENYYLN